MASLRKQRQQIAEILQVFVLEMADRVANMSGIRWFSPEVLKELCETQTSRVVVKL